MVQLVSIQSRSYSVATQQLFRFLYILQQFLSQTIPVIKQYQFPNKRQRKERARAHSCIERINGDSTSADENLIGLEIRNIHIRSELQQLRSTKTWQNHGSTGGDEAPQTYLHGRAKRAVIRVG